MAGILPHLNIFKNNTKFCAILLVLSALGCKYEDGPTLSLRSREKRVVGEYMISKFEKGGINLTDSLKKMLCYSKLVFSKDGSFKSTSEIDSCKFSGNWALSHNDERLILQFWGIDTILEPLGRRWGGFHWDILRLTDDEIHLTLTHENQFVKLNLKQY